MSIRPHLIKNDNLTSFFKSFFGISVISAYVCVTQDTDNDSSVLWMHDSHVSDMFKNINPCMTIDATCEFILELDFGFEHRYIEIQLAQQFSPMIISKFDINDAIFIKQY
jgi:hypothetical protein